MKIKRLALKALLYRVLSLIWVQFMTWVIFQKVDINLVVLFSDIVITTPFYFIFDLIWNKGKKDGT